MSKIFNKNLEKNKKNNNNNNEPKNKYKIPSLNYLKLNQINKLNFGDEKKNIILYNNIIKPFHNTITLNDNENKNIKKMNRYGYKNSDSNPKGYNIFNGRKFIFDLPENPKNKILNVTKSCFFENFIKLGNINYKPRSRSVYVGSCLACDLGFSISRSGYSPMTFSPYDKKRRKSCGVIPSDIIYEQYTRHKKNLIG